MSDDGTKAFCVYEAPTPEAVRRTALRAGLPVDGITEVRVLDPYFYASMPNEKLRTRNQLPVSTRKEET